MPTAGEIKKYCVRVATSDAKADRSMLKDIGHDLRIAHRKKLNSDYIFWLEDLLDRLYVKHVDNNKEYEEAHEDFWFEVRGQAKGLGHKLATKNLDGQFYTDALKLGRKLDKLASMLNAVVLCIIANRALVELINNMS